jgi:hypothetical protein
MASDMRTNSFRHENTIFLACRDDCPESYYHDPGVGVSVGVTPQGKNFNLGYIF